MIPRKWMGKLATRFPMGSSIAHRRRAHDGPARPAVTTPTDTHFSNKPASDSRVIHWSPGAEFPERTSSLPRPTSGLIYGKPHPQPAVSPDASLPASVSKMGSKRSGSKKSFLNETCTLCEEPIFNRNKGERVIELKCGHLSHQECMMVTFGNEYGVEQDLYSLFPNCTKCKLISRIDGKCIPKNDDLKDKLVSDYLIHNNVVESPKSASPTVSSQMMFLTPTTAVSPAVSQFPLEARTLLQPAPVPNNPPIIKEGGDYEPEITNVMKSGLNNTYTQNLRNRFLAPTRNTRGSSIFASSSVVTSVYDNESRALHRKTNSEISEMPDKKQSTYLPLVRSYFTEMLLTFLDNKMMNWELDSKFGLLRLVDKLLSARASQDDYVLTICFLFEKALVLVEVVDDLESLLKYRALGSTTINIEDSVLRVDPIDVTALQCEVRSVNEADRVTSFRLKELKDGKSSKVVEKWISALLDATFKFSCDDVTSTLPSLPILRGFREEVAENSTILGLISATKVVELGTLSDFQDNTIIRRGFVLNENVDDASFANTVQSMMTSISSILSLKRERPDDLLIIIQLDIRKFMKQHNLNILINTFKALLLKYRNAKISVINSKGYVLVTDYLRNVVEKFANLEAIDQDSESVLFDPVDVKTRFYGSEIHFNIGVVAISNSEMDETVNCLFKDYSIFKSHGRKHQNDLKVRIGYLNVDYTDKIRELVEVDSWDFLLEALCYSFSLNFDDDDEDDDDLVNIANVANHSELSSLGSLSLEHIKKSGTSPKGNSRLSNIGFGGAEIKAQELTIDEFPNLGLVGEENIEHSPLEPFLNNIQKIIDEMKGNDGDTTDTKNGIRLYL